MTDHPAPAAPARGASVDRGAIRDGSAYRRVLGDFVAQRASAAVFIAGFRDLWACEAGEDGAAPSGATRGPPDARGILAAVRALCETYAHSLPCGHGYRVSEEQFRKEVQSIAAVLPRTDPPPA